MKIGEDVKAVGYGVLNMLVFALYVWCWLLLLSSPASASPSVEKVLISPLYASSFNTLTCNFVSNESSPTAQYQWYDSCSGIWSSGSATKSSPTTGCSYNCSVNLSNGGSTGFYNSSNLVTVAASCLNPLPFKYCSYNKTNLTYMRATYPNSIYQYNLTYANVSEVPTGYGNQTVFEKGCIFLGGYVGESGANSSYTNPFGGVHYNLIQNATAYGSMNYAATTTDENWGSYDERVTSVGSKYSRFYTNTTFPSGSLVNMTVGVYTLGAGTSTTISIMTNQTDGGGNTTLCSYTNTAAGAGRYQYNCSYTLTETCDDIIINLTSAVATSYGAVWEVVVTKPINGSALIDNIDDFTQSEGALYNFSYLDEETQAKFNLSTNGILNKSDQRIYCSSTVTERNISDQYAATYLIGVKEIPSKIENLLTYDDGSDYYRRMSYCDRYKSHSAYLINTSTSTATLFTFTIDDQSGTGQWEDGQMCLSRYVDTILEEVSCDNWAADYTIQVYLIANREYSINLLSDDCSEEKNIGWITASPADTSKEITVAGMDFNTTTTGILKYASFSVYWDNQSGRINTTFTDADDEVDWFWWGAYDASNDSLMYSDNTTADSYAGTYLAALANNTYYVRALVGTEAGDVFEYVEGGLKKAVDYFNFLRYDGEMLGFEYKTLTLFGSLGVMAVTALMAGPLSVGIAAVLLVIEAFTFSIFGWLPFISNINNTWPLILATGGIIAVFLHYTKGGKG